MRYFLEIDGEIRARFATCTPLSMTARDLHSSIDGARRGPLVPNPITLQHGYTECHDFEGWLRDNRGHLSTPRMIDLIMGNAKHDETDLRVCLRNAVPVAAELHPYDDRAGRIPIVSLTLECENWREL